MDLFSIELITLIIAGYIGSDCEDFVQTVNSKLAYLHTKYDSRYFSKNSDDIRSHIKSVTCITLEYIDENEEYTKYAHKELECLYGNNIPKDNCQIRHLVLFNLIPSLHLFRNLTVLEFGDDFNQI